MLNEFYPIPFPFKKIIERKNSGKTDLANSIAQQIHLVLASFPGEHRYNKDFGCYIWELDFQTIYNVNEWKDKVEDSALKSILKNEGRLNNIEVHIEIQQEEFEANQLSKSITIRKRLDVEVTGRLKKTNELFVFSEPIYMSPISMD